MQYRNYLLAILLIAPFFDEGVYDFEIESADGKAVISLKSFAGKKMLITPMKQGTVDTAKISDLNLLQLKNPDLKVVLVPAIDLEDRKSDKWSTIKDSLSLGIHINKPVFVQKFSGRKQHPLFAWLTHAKLNGHFNMDVEGTGQYFLISEKGELYAVLAGDTPAEVLNRALSEHIN
jgi:glutathione peroxidase